MSEFFETKLFWITAIAFAIYLYLKYYVFNYWQRHGIPCEPPSIPLGNVPFKFFLGKISLGDFIKENYNKFNKHPFHGFYVFHKPIMIINDPELVRAVMIKEFHRFQNHGWFYNGKTDEMSENLFILPGEKWKKLRSILSPLFTSGKLKQMYPLFSEVSNEMISLCDVKLKKSNVLEMKDIMGRYTTEIIASIVYGIKSNSIQNPHSEFRDHGMKSFEFVRLLLLTSLFAPEFLEIFNMSATRKCVRDFFIKTFKDTIDYRHKEKIMRKDLLNLLMQLMDVGEVEDDDGNISNDTKTPLEKLSMVQAAAQAYGFFIAGYETSSSTTTYALLELALNPEIQDKLREEIDRIVETTGTNYDSVMGNEYLDMVLAETLRKHPMVPAFNRICEEDFLIPNSNFTIPKGMRVVIPASGIHENSDFYPNPKTFDPTRFSKENAAKRKNYVYLGFGDGPRYCIGQRFGQLQVKQALVALLRNYKFYISEKTPIPVKYTTYSIVQTPGSGVYLRVEKRNL